MGRYGKNQNFSILTIFPVQTNKTKLINELIKNLTIFLQNDGISSTNPYKPDTNDLNNLYQSTKVYGAGKMHLRSY